MAKKKPAEQTLSTRYRDLMMALLRKSLKDPSFYFDATTTNLFTDDAKVYRIRVWHAGKEPVTIRVTPSAYYILHERFEKLEEILRRVK